MKFLTTVLVGGALMFVSLVLADALALSGSTRNAFLLISGAIAGITIGHLHPKNT